ncbi:MAG: hypothetical protein ABL917_01685 [Parcubacteria group bacterium]
MSFLLAIPYYLLWHYGLALKDIKNIWFNFIAFVYNFFSIPVLFSTIFAPWERIKDYGNSAIWESFIFNSLMRIVGVCIRSLFIFIGLLSVLVTIFAGVIVYFFWFFGPFMILNIFIWGINQFFV